MRFRKDSAPDAIREKAKRRLGRLATPDVMNWADGVGTGIAKAIDDFRRTGETLALQEAQEGVSALAGAIDVLVQRSLD